MAKLETLIEEVKDPRLRAALEREFKQLKERQSYGLVFERRLP
jgi:hypothetical protein